MFHHGWGSSIHIIHLHHAVHLHIAAIHHLTFHWRHWWPPVVVSHHFHSSHIHHVLHHGAPAEQPVQADESQQQEASNREADANPHAGHILIFGAQIFFDTILKTVYLTIRTSLLKVLNCLIILNSQIFLELRLLVIVVVRVCRELMILVALGHVR